MMVVAQVLRSLASSLRQRLSSVIALLACCVQPGRIWVVFTTDSRLCVELSKIHILLISNDEYKLSHAT